MVDERQCDMGSNALRTESSMKSIGSVMPQAKRKIKDSLHPFLLGWRGLKRKF
jgi:hypothetical protein